MKVALCNLGGARDFLKKLIFGGYASFYVVVVIYF